MAKSEECDASKLRKLQQHGRNERLDCRWASDGDPREVAQMTRNAAKGTMMCEHRHMGWGNVVNSCMDYAGKEKTSDARSCCMWVAEEEEEEVRRRGGRGEEKKEKE